METKKEQLLTGLADVRERILSMTTSLPVEKQDQTFLGIWTPKDLLAHLAGWDETNLKAAKEVLEGKLPGFYVHYDRDWAIYNALLVAEYGREELDELLSLLRETHGRLLAFLEDLPAGELWKDRGIRARGWKVTIGRLLEAEMQDEEEHFLQLKDFAEAGAE